MENIMNITHHRRVSSLFSGWWHDIKVNTADGEFHASARVFDEGSQYGINEGRVSALHITDPKGVCAYNYDRGLDIPPRSKMAGLVADYIVALFDIHGSK